MSSAPPRIIELVETFDRNIEAYHSQQYNETQLRSLINDRFSPSPLGFIDIGFEELAEGTVCRVDVQASEEIIHLDNEVYVRDGNRTQKLEGPALTNWIQQRTS